MKTSKTITLLATFALLLQSFSPASAQTSTSSLQEVINSLLAQVAALQTQLQNASTTKPEVKESLGEIKDTLKLIAQLDPGARGEAVKLLQIALAADPEIYPEGLISGFYGSLTSQAVKRFQKAHGLEQVGRVGPKTIAKLNEALAKNPVIQNNENGKAHCAIVPPGHLIAPGWLRKQDGVRPIVPECQKLPPGILDKLQRTTTTPDTVAPAISQVFATGTTVNSTHVIWKTDEPSTSKIWYNYFAPVDTSSTSTPSAGSENLVKDHDLVLSGLQPSTMYYFIVSSKDKAGNIATSTQYSFLTSATADTTPPVLTYVEAVGITTTSSHITWRSDEMASGKIWLGTSVSLTATGTPYASTNALSIIHDFPVAGLTASTTYYYVVASEDASGNLAASARYSFSTLPLPDTAAPVLSVPSASSTASSAQIIWTTDEAATSKVTYSTSSPATGGLVVSLGGLVTTHSVSLIGLTASTTYYYIVSSADAAGNTSSAPETSFVTPGS